MKRPVALLVSLAGAALFAAPASAASATGAASNGLLPADPGSSQDSTLLLAKEQARLRVGRDGSVQILSTAPAATYPVARVLDTTWTGKIWEAEGSGTDDLGVAYSDANYWNFCGPGATAVVLWYWPAGQAFVMQIPRTAYTEPNPSLSIRATTTWDATDAVSNGRGAIMYLAMKEQPAGTSWAWPGVIDWSRAYPYDATPVNRIRDALNWEISGRTSISGPYVWVRYSRQLNETALHNYVHQDVGTSGVPLVANVATSSGRYHLPNWRGPRSVNHSITIVGYDDSAGTYTYIDTCGPRCNNTGSPAGVYTVSQHAMWVLLRAEGYDGVIA